MNENEILQTPATEEDIAPKPLIPGEMKTVFGRGIRTNDDTSKAIFPVRYTLTGINGYFVRCDAIKNPSRLLVTVDGLYENPDWTDERGNDVSTVVLPIDAVEINEAVKGLIVDTGLQQYQNGWDWFFSPARIACCAETYAFDVFQMLYQVVQTASCLWQKGYALEEWDGHQFYFYPEYQTVSFLFDGCGCIRLSENVDADAALKAVQGGLASALSYCLTGENEDGAFLTEEIRLLLEKAKQTTVSFSEWLDAFQNALKEKDVCFACEKQLPKHLETCPFCQVPLKKEHFWTRWEIVCQNPAKKVRLSFGRSTVISGTDIAPALGNQPLLSLLYNENQNILGLRNMSRIVWNVISDSHTKSIDKNQVAEIRKGMVITFAGYQGIKMTFLGYEFE